MLKLRILSCSDPMRWYSNRIGDLVDYLPILDDGETYGSRENGGYINFVLKRDSVVIETDVIQESTPMQDRPLGTEEQITVQVTRYRDEDGQPTCACDFNVGRVCIFYCTQKFGLSETCWFADKEGRRWTQLHRRDGGNGTLIPLPTCPLWVESAECLAVETE